MAITEKSSFASSILLLLSGNGILMLQCHPFPVEPPDKQDNSHSNVLSTSQANTLLLEAYFLCNTVKQKYKYNQSTIILYIILYIFETPNNVGDLSQLPSSLVLLYSSP